MVLENEQLLDDIINITKEYLKGNEDTSNVLNYLNAEDLYKKLNLHLDEKGVDRRSLVDEVKNYLHYSPRTSHPLFSNQLSGGFNTESFIAEIISFVTNSTMATYEAAPVANLIEKKLIDYLGEVIGYENAGGIMVTGGSNANMMAIHCARNSKYKNTKSEGTPNKNLCIYVSKEAHYSFKKAVILLGLGTNNLITVQTLEDGSMDPQDLETKIEATLKRGDEPLIICSTSGTTVLGAFDDLEANSRIARKYNLWHHVDGAWGGPAAFTPKLQHLIKGLENTDSFTFDAHKAMGTGLITSFFLLKDEDKLRQANGNGGESYLFHESENSDFDSGHLSVQCGRKVDALKLWLYWKSLGHEGVREEIERRLSLCNYLKDKIENHPQFQLIHRPKFLNLCFQVIPQSNLDINEFNKKLRLKIIKQGKMMVNFSTFDNGSIFFRQVFANNQMDEKYCDRFIEIILENAQSVI